MNLKMNPTFLFMVLTYLPWMTRWTESCHFSLHCQICQKFSTLFWIIQANNISNWVKLYDLRQMLKIFKQLQNLGYRNYSKTWKTGKKSRGAARYMVIKVVIYISNMCIDVIGRLRLNSITPPSPPWKI